MVCLSLRPIPGSMRKQTDNAQMCCLLCGYIHTRFECDLFWRLLRKQRNNAQICRIVSWDGMSAIRFICTSHENKQNNAQICCVLKCDGKVVCRIYLWLASETISICGWMCFEKYTSVQCPLIHTQSKDVLEKKNICRIYLAEQSLGINA